MHNNGINVCNYSNKLAQVICSFEWTDANLINLMVWSWKSLPCSIFYGFQGFHGEMSQQLESYTSVDINSSGQEDIDAHVLDLKLKVINIKIEKIKKIFIMTIKCMIMYSGTDH